MGFEPELYEIASYELLEGFRVRVECVQYEQSVYTDDSNPADASYASITPATPPAAVEDPAVSEAFARVGVSRLTATWSLRLGAVRYEVFIRINTGSGGDWQLAARTMSGAVSFDVRAPFGVSVTVAVVAIARDGSARAPANSAQRTIAILRLDDSATVAEIPGNVPGTPTITLVDGNTWRLAWEAVAGADRYEVRFDPWVDAVTLYSGTDTHFDFQPNMLAQQLQVRAAKGGFYSRRVAFAGTPAAAWPGFTEHGVTKVADFDDGAIQNGIKIRDYFGQFGQSLMQVDDRYPLQYVTRAWDAGAVRVHFLSLDVRVNARPQQPLGTLFLSDPNFSLNGPINGSVLDWQLVLMTSDDDAVWVERPLAKDYFAAPVFAEARYFKLKVIVSVKPNADGRRSYLAAVKRLALKWSFEP